MKLNSSMQPLVEFIIPESSDKPLYEQLFGKLNGFAYLKSEEDFDNAIKQLQLAKEKYLLLIQKLL